MARVSAKEGDVFHIPLESGASAICRVLYKSQYFKKVILIAVYGLVDAEAEAADQITAPIKGLFYCSSVNIEKGEWHVFHNVPVNAEERLHSKRIVGGSVWIEDQCIGDASPDSRNLPQMDTHGERILAKKIELLLQG
jgi:hypothetical protein